MKAIVFAVGWTLAALLLIAALYSLVRWARRDRRGATIVGSALVLLFGGGLVPDSSRQRTEEAREDKGKKGAESGDPPEPGSD